MIYIIEFSYLLIAGLLILFLMVLDINLLPAIVIGIIWPVALAVTIVDYLWKFIKFIYYKLVLRL